MKEPIKTIAPVTPRAIALEILQLVLRKQQAFDEVLERNAQLPALEKRDRGFVHAMVATTLRRMGQIDDALKSCLDKPEEVKPVVMDLLRLGAAQLLFMATPPHAVVDSMVELTGQNSATMPYKGFVNAILRRLSREGAELVAKQDAARLNIAGWLWLGWRQNFGTAVAREVAMANLGEALTDISVKENSTAWAGKLNARLLPTGSLRLNGAESITTLPGFAEGDWWVQDAAAALPVKLLGDVRNQTVIDLCAAPGGKTAQLAALGANVIAVDRSDKRLLRLNENMQRLHYTIETVCSDALTYKPKTKATFVLLDAPCTATGTIRRHPDVMRLKTSEDMRRMADLQARLLDHTITNILAPGGTLIYAVCSLQPEEAEAQIEALLQRNSNVKRQPVTVAEVGGEAHFINPQGDLRCLPHHWPDFGGVDGFYAARLQLAT